MQSQFFALNVILNCPQARKVREIVLEASQSIRRRATESDIVRGNKRTFANPGCTVEEEGEPAWYHQPMLLKELTSL